MTRITHIGRIIENSYIDWESRERLALFTMAGVGGRLRNMPLGPPEYDLNPIQYW